MVDTPGQGSLTALLGDRNRRFPLFPRMVTDVRVFRMPDGLGVRFHAGDTPTMLRGAKVDRVIDFLLPRLDGSSSLEQLFESCPPDIPSTSLVRTLDLLHTKGLLADGLDPVPAPETDPALKRQLLFWGRHVGATRSSNNGAEVQRRVAGTRCAVIGTGEFAALTVDLLTRSGCEDLRVIAWDDDGELLASLAKLPAPPREMAAPKQTSIEEVIDVLDGWVDDLDLVVTVTRNGPDALFEAVNRTCLRTDVPWLRADEDPSGYDIGPYVDPWSSACFTCLVLRRRSMQEHPIEDHLAQVDLATERDPGTTAPIGESIVSATLGASLVVSEVVRIATNLASPTLLNTVLHVSPTSGAVERNAVLRVPRCEACHRGAVPPPPPQAPGVTGG